MTTTKASTKTRTIAGRKITLVVGQRYYASRPMATRRGETFPVSVTNFSTGEKRLVCEMSYDDANKFLDAFNNEECSLSGREW